MGIRFPLSGSIFSRSCTLIIRFLLAFRLSLTSDKASSEESKTYGPTHSGAQTCTLRKRPLPLISVVPLRHNPRPAPDASPYDICRVAQMFVFVNNGVSVLVFLYKLSKNCEQLYYRALHCILNILMDGMRGFNKITSMTGRHVRPLIHPLADSVSCKLERARSCHST